MRGSEKGLGGSEEGSGCSEEGPRPLPGAAWRGRAAGRPVPGTALGAGGASPSLPSEAKPVPAPSPRPSPLRPGQGLELGRPGSSRRGCSVQGGWGEGGGEEEGGIRPRRAEPGLGGSQQLAAGTPPPRPRRSSAAPLRVGFWGRGGSGLEAGREAPHAPPRSLPAMAAAGAAEGPLAARRAGAARRGKAPPRPVPLGSSRPLGLLGFYFSPSG